MKVHTHKDRSMIHKTVRSFLNLPHFHSTASIFGKVVISEERKTVSGQLEITDCERKILLRLEANTTKQYENTLHKLSTIIQGCQKMQEIISEAKEQKFETKGLFNVMDNAEESEVDGELKNRTNYNGPLWKLEFGEPFKWAKNSFSSQINWYAQEDQE